MAHLERDAPHDDAELFRWYRECIDRSVAWGRERAMFDVPADYRLDLLPTPPALVLFCPRLIGAGGQAFAPLALLPFLAPLA